ncbi:CLUMA_CG011067, isoform A [Clunio marinus]|uniref:CLUMA_CG011067, isoform A n=1 Tax=Clunio marinus TaxID=568069 RepID=A0A1J1IBN0_9DIPT|nr:CLUMA_CG011067, isoform A [Clunio marinus]
MREELLNEDGKQNKSAADADSIYAFIRESRFGSYDSVTHKYYLKLHTKLVFPGTLSEGEMIDIYSM